MKELRYMQIYEQIKHLKEITIYSVMDKCDLPQKESFSVLRSIEDTFLIKKVKSIFSKNGHEMFIYTPIDQTKCSKCGIRGVKFYQHVICKECLHLKFAEIRPLINNLRGNLEILTQR